MVSLLFDELNEELRLLLLLLPPLLLPPLVRLLAFNDAKNDTGVLHHLNENVDMEDIIDLQDDEKTQNDGNLDEDVIMSQPPVCTPTKTADFSDMEMDMTFNKQPNNVTPEEDEKQPDVTSPNTLTSENKRREKLISLIVRHNKDLGRPMPASRITILQSETMLNLASIQAAVSKEKYASLNKQNLEQKFDNANMPTKRIENKHKQHKITFITEL